MSAPAGWWGGSSDDPVVQAAMAAGASQDANELAVAVTEVEALKPQVVVEIGCDRGGTLLAWRACCDRVYGITLNINDYDSGGSGLPLETYGATVRIGDSHDPESLAWLAGELGPDLVDVLVLDGDHHVAGIYQDLAMYGPLVRAGGLILLHDIKSVGDDRAEVWKVWPDLAGRFETSEIADIPTADGLPGGGPGWGLIRVRPGDSFQEAQ